MSNKDQAFWMMTAVAVIELLAITYLLFVR